MFSVIVCTYNRADVLPRAIRSAQRQTWADFELIVVDDASSDDTAGTVRKFAAADSRVRRVRRAANGGVAAARNTGIAAASRPWITFLDSDDTYLAEHLEVRARSIREFPETDLIYSPAAVVGRTWVPDLRDVRRRIPLDRCRIGGTFFIRRNRVIDAGGFPEVEYGDDSLFFDAAEKNGFRIRRLDSRTYVYHRLGTDTLTRRMEAAVPSNASVRRNA